MAQKKIPARQCIGCLTSRPKKELVRVVRAPSGEISIDPVGKKPGRGAYLCPDAACLAKAKKKKALERCFEQPVPAEVYDALAQQLDIQHAALQVVDLQLTPVGPERRAHLLVQHGFDLLPLFPHVFSSCSAALAAAISSRMRWRVLSNSSSRLWRK